MKHCPLNMKRMDRPLFHFSMGYASSYDHTVLNNILSFMTRPTGRCQPSGTRSRRALLTG
jgi:hypothetical protein